VSTNTTDVANKQETNRTQLPKSDKMLAPQDIFFRTIASSRYTYSKEDRAYVCKIEGPRSKSSVVKIPPPNSGKSLSISCRYLFLQVRRRSSDDFTFTITLRDDPGNHFNFAFSTITRKSERPSSSQTSALVHLDIPKNIWVTVVFDLQQVAEQFWRPAAFHQLDSIEVAPSCTLSRIFAQDAPPSYAPNGQLVLPRQYSFPSGIPSASVFVPTITADPEPPARAQTSPPPPPTAGSGMSVQKKPRTQEKRFSKPERVPQPLEVTPTRAKAVPKKAIEEDDESDGAFDGVAPSSPVEILSGLPDNEEDELELVYVEKLGCYYCPGNQQYYQIDDQ
jgi:hypothetical protein